MFNVLTGEHENWLAETWEYNDDFTEITMKLREGITWQDGMPFTAEDVAFTFNLVRDHQDEMVHTAEIHLMDRAEALDALHHQVLPQAGFPELVGHHSYHQPRGNRADIPQARLGGRRGRDDLRLLRPR